MKRKFSDAVEIVLALDWGTWKWVAAYAMYQDGKKVALPAPLLINDRTHEVRMMATWIGNEFVHGAELAKRAGENRELSDTIIDLFKLSLYPKKSEVVRRTEAILAEMPGNKTLDMLITEHLKAVIKDCKVAILKSEEQMDYSKAELEQALEDLRVRITVPVIWTPHARQRMQSAARDAGIDVCVLASEPQCALAYLVHKHAQKKLRRRGLGKGDHILVADIGCGTGDFALLRLEGQLTINSKLEVVGGATGSMCGSIDVDLHLLELLKKRKGRSWYLKTSQRLGVTERDLGRRIGLAIEEAKRQFGQGSTAVGRIYGANGVNEEISFTEQEVKDALDKVIKKIIVAMNELIDQASPAVIQVTGGFSKSSYLMEKLSAEYKDMLVIRPNESDTADCYPVVMGALLRYDNVTILELPSRYGYAILQRQDFREDRHKDSWDRDRDGKIVPKAWVLTDPHDSCNDVVNDRIATILEKGELLEPGQDVTSVGDILCYTLPHDNPLILEPLVYLTKHFEENSMAMEEADDRDERVLRDGAHHWKTMNIALPKNKLEAGGFPSIVTDGEKFWQVRVRVMYRYDGHDLQIGLRIIKPPNDDGEDEAVKEGDVDRKDRIAFEVWDTVWDAKHNDFLQ